MLTYVLKRIADLITLLFFISILIFIVINTKIAAPKKPTKEDLSDIEQLKQDMVRLKTDMDDLKKILKRF